MRAQRFGGSWSLIKVETVASYLKGFNVALKNQKFQRIYIDAFAGSGSFSFPLPDAGGLFGSEPAIAVHAGTARRALQTEPGFDRLFFIENDSENLASLRDLIGSFGAERRAEVLDGDANTEVSRICSQTPWNSTRGVIFLDPFGNDVAWSTLEAIARTKLDVWYLFPLSGVYRNAPHSHDALTEDKRRTITRILGSADWEEKFYRSKTRNLDLFGSADSHTQRSEDVDGIEEFVISRLKSIFPLVEKPRRLFGPSNAPLFSLFFAMTNDSKKAQKVALPIARHILRTT